MTITLKDGERDLVLDILDAFIASLHDPAAREMYAAVREEVARGEVKGPAVDALARVLEIALQTGHVRRQHDAHAEKALVRVFHRTPQGEALVAMTQKVNQALQALVGRSLQAISLTPGVPGEYRLTLSADGAQLVVRFGPQGVQVDSMAVG